MGFIEIVSPGALTSVQDLGRPGLEHLGISPSGAADALSLRAGNRVLGNADGSAALEMTLTGARVGFEADATFALSGAEMNATLDGAPVPRLQARKARSGQTLALGPAVRGCRAYLCIQGGFDVPSVLGSASTHLQSRIGGWHGRAVKKGDRIPIAPAQGARTRSLTGVDRLVFKNVFRVSPSIHSGLFDKTAWTRFLRSSYTVGLHSNRLGLRLDGPAIAEAPAVATTGVTLGCIQISTDGLPTILFVEQQLTGGYPVLASVISADTAALGQLKPGDQIRFKKVTFAQALSALKKVPL
jgi:antagonist of KipI